MSVCNMTIEGGARAGMVAPDEITFAYLKGRPLAPKPSLPRSLACVGFVSRTYDMSDKLGGIIPVVSNFLPSGPSLGVRPNLKQRD